MADSGRSEDVYGEKIDRCIYNSVVKFVGGVGVGIVFSLALFKRRPWPIILGGGIGIGMGLSDSNYEFQGNSQPPVPSHPQRNRALEKLISWKKEFMADKSEPNETPDKLLSGVGKKLAVSEKFSETSAADKRAERNKYPKNKPFLSVSEHFEKRNIKD